MTEKQEKTKMQKERIFSTEGWFNNVTQEIDYLELGAGSRFTDDEAKQYIPQSVAAQSMYSCYRELGISIPIAMIGVLEASCGNAKSIEELQAMSVPD